MITFFNKFDQFQQKRLVFFFLILFIFVASLFKRTVLLFVSLQRLKFYSVLMFLIDSPVKFGIAVPPTTQRPVECSVSKAGSERF